MPEIILSTLNARYTHTSLGLRYLYANIGSWQRQTVIKEYVINKSAHLIVEDLLKDNPLVITFGVYIWNITETTHVVTLLKTLRPDIAIVIGGPEVSYEWQDQTIFSLCDVLITGPGEISLRKWLDVFLGKPIERAFLPKVIHGETAPLSELHLPYQYYNDEDIAHRYIYVEASRGCPFKCEFCLSSLDKTAKPFPLKTFLLEMDALYQRGARVFKFVDRTFNLNIKTSIEILQFFLDRMDDKLFVHFELIPDHLPDSLKAFIQKFPPGQLQLEIGIQTFNPNVQSLISRKQDNQLSEENLSWLRQNSHAHLHTDLIIGLPGESFASIAQSFDRLHILNPHEIQVGILKRLRGTPIIRHTQSYSMRYDPLPPYALIANQDLDFFTMQHLTRFARYWDLYANSGRFPNSMTVLLNKTPFASFWKFSIWLYEKTGQVHQFQLEKLVELLWQGLQFVAQVSPEEARVLLIKDLQNTKVALPNCLKTAQTNTKSPARSKLSTRQTKHLVHDKIQS